MNRYRADMGRTLRGFDMVHKPVRTAGFHRGIFQIEQRDGDLQYSEERIAEAEARKAKAKEAELSKGDRNG
ncbi:hypothetical protein [Desulfocurvus sp. DL9XJH121]